MEKNIYEILNDADGGLDNFEIIELSDIEKAKLKKTFRRKNRKNRTVYKVASIAVAVFLFSIIFARSELGLKAYAKVESAISGLNYTIAESFYQDKDLEEYVNVINQVVEDKGIAIKITECAVDVDELILTFVTEKSGEAIIDSDLDYRVYINGKKAKVLGMVGSQYSKNGISYSKKILNIKGIEEGDISDVEILVKKLDLGLLSLEDYSNIQPENYGEHKEEKTIRGRWKFAFKASREELSKNTVVIPVDEDMDLGAFTVKVEKITMNPINRKIYAKIIEGEDDFGYEVDFIGYDDEGNYVEFGERTYDSKTKELVLSYENLGSKLSDKAKKITLNAYVSELPKGGGKIGEAKKCGDELIINLENVK